MRLLSAFFDDKDFSLEEGTEVLHICGARGRIVRISPSTQGTDQHPDVLVSMENGAILRCTHLNNTIFVVEAECK